MSLPLVEEIDVSTEFVRIKFGITPKVSSLTNDVFKIYIDGATPTLVDDPFETIDLEDNYNTISKLLTLYWNSGVLEANLSYQIVISGLHDASGMLIEDSTYYFTTGDSVTQDPENLPPPETPIEIEDHSIQSALFTNITSIIASNPDFYILETDPINFDFDLPEDYNNGVISIKFSAMPNPAFLSETYFKVQKKKIQRKPSRWTTLDVRIIGDFGSNTVYIQLPSTDDDPVYDTEDTTYFEESYKYRIIISKDVSI